uniref:Uncharacterized protein n=1 Tax=Pavo cristatus TaxID=9049 RepID=A0A8C9FGT5_PAVCR
QLSHPHACPTRSCPAPLAPPTEDSPATTACPRPPVPPTPMCSPRCTRTPPSFGMRPLHPGAPDHPIHSPSLSTVGSPLAEIPIRIPTYVLALGASHPFASPNPAGVHQLQKGLKLGECLQTLLLLHVPPDLPPLLGMGRGRIAHPPHMQRSSLG